MCFSQKKDASLLTGKVLEKITRLDGEVIYQPVQGMKVYIKEAPGSSVLSKQDGSYTLALESARDERVIKVVVEKDTYKMLLEKNAYNTVSFLTVVQNQTNKRDINLDIYVTKTASLQSSGNNIFRSIGLSGYVQKGEQNLEGVEIKVKGIESVHDNTNPDGYFEIYLPESKFNAEESFTVILEKEGSIQELSYDNLNQFNRENSLEFNDYEFPKEDEEEVSTESEEEVISSTVDNVEAIKELDGLQIETSFRNFITSLDTLDFKKLSTEKIQALKDSLNKYANYLTNLREEFENIQGRNNLDTLEKVEKKLIEKQAQLADKEKELFEAQIANQTKTIIILSLIIVLIVISSLSYYYFYINKKIQSQSSELNKRNQFIEFLLRELNHRVTNNLQVISSMLKRKIRRLPDENSKNALKEINNRVMDISTVHVGLYSKNDDRITKLYDYLTKITQILEKLYGFSNRPLKIEVKSPDIEIAHKNAVYFGLIINELVTNSLKYAFEGVESPKLIIEIEKLKDKKFFIKVEDNGRGIPDTFNLAEAKSSGLKLVNLITQMLDGSFEMSSQEGAKFELTLKV